MFLPFYNYQFINNMLVISQSAAPPHLSSSNFDSVFCNCCCECRFVIDVTVRQNIDHKYADKLISLLRWETYIYFKIWTRNKLFFSLKTQPTPDLNKHILSFHHAAATYKEELEVHRQTRLINISNLNVLLSPLNFTNLMI